MAKKIKRTSLVLHKYLFTVTTFLKILAMILFIALPFLGFYLGMQYQKMLTITNSPIVLEVHQVTSPTSSTTQR